jgi:hypothetical protein
MLPNRAFIEPFEDALDYIDWRGEEERRQQRDAADRECGERVPARDRDHGDEKLKQEERAS